MRGGVILSEAEGSSCAPREDPSTVFAARDDTWIRAALLVLALLAAGCHHRDLAFPSPDGKHTAAVLNHWSIDPPKQSVWVDGTKIRDLAEDQDWCREVAWSPNGAMVGFLVQDAKLITVDAATKRIVSERWLVDRDGYPTSQMVCALRLDDTGEPAFTTRARSTR